MTAGCKVAVVELDFDRRQETAIPLPDAAAAMASGRFVWIDLDAGDLTGGTPDAVSPSRSSAGQRFGFQAGPPFLAGAGPPEGGRSSAASGAGCRGCFMSNGGRVFGIAVGPEAVGVEAVAEPAARPGAVRLDLDLVLARAARRAVRQQVELLRGRLDARRDLVEAVLHVGAVLRRERPRPADARQLLRVDLLAGADDVRLESPAASRAASTSSALARWARSVPSVNTTSVPKRSGTGACSICCCSTRTPSMTAPFRLVDGSRGRRLPSAATPARTLPPKLTTGVRCGLPSKV